MKRVKIIAWTLTVVCLATAILSGCGGNTQVVLTSGLKEDEIFQIESEVCTKSEMMLYLTNTQKVYEEVYGTQIWDTETEGISMEDKLKESVLSKISRIKVMKLLAKDQGVSLSKEEEQKAERAGRIYFNTLTDAEKTFLDIKEDTVIESYKEYALANKLYEYLVRDVNPEISDDEARTVTVSHIFIKTYRIDSHGKKEPYSESLKIEAYKRAQVVYQQVREGVLFSDLVATESEDDAAEFSFRKGEMDATYEEVAFNLATDEISSVVETPDGYYIIKCLNTFNREETDANKVLLLEERKRKAFEDVYSNFLGTLTGNINNKMWDEMTLSDDPAITTNTFFDTYELYFEENPLEYEDGNP